MWLAVHYIITIRVTLGNTKHKHTSEWIDLSDKSVRGKSRFFVWLRRC